MTTKHADFLRVRASELSARIPDRNKVIAEWTTACAELFARIREWIREADPEGLLTVEESTDFAKEADLRKYRVPKLQIQDINNLVTIVPVSRFVVGPWISENGHPVPSLGVAFMSDGSRKYRLYLVRREPRPEWFISAGRGEPARPLTAVEFENALLSFNR